MRSKLVLFILLFLPGVAVSKGLFFNHLNRLYSQNTSRCIEASKRYIKLFPGQPVPYYFASFSYKNKVDISKTTRGRYLNLNRCIEYALKFEETCTENSVQEIKWSNFKKSIKVCALAVVEELKKENEFRMSERLTGLFIKLYGGIEIPTIKGESNFSIEDELELLKFSTEAIYITAESHVKFYGLPTGREIVASSDLVGELELLRLVNKDRVRKGQKPLVWDEGLARAARYHSYDLATQNYFNHSSYDRENGKLVRVGSTFDRIHKFYSKSFVNSENIAAGNKDASSTYQQWYTSKGHYDNMFNRASGKVGIGVYYDPNSSFGYYWTFCTAE